MKVRILFSVPTTYEVSFNPKDFEWEMNKEGFDFEDPEAVGEWFESYAPDWLIEDGELVDMDCGEVETIEAVKDN